MLSGWVWRAALGVTVLLGGCVESSETQVKSAFAMSYACDESAVHLKQKWPGRYEASGCGHYGVYNCSDAAGGCVVYTGAPTVTADDFMGEGKLFFSATLQPDGLLKLTAWPKQGDKAELGFETTRGENCQIQLVLDGEHVELERVAAQPKIAVPAALLDDLGRTEQLSVLACGGEWTLSAPQMNELHLFAQHYADQAVGAKPGTANAAASKRRAPHGGWPSWKALGDFPAASATSAATLAGPQLFEKLAPSVLRVEAKVGVGYSQGSAVAIAPTLALTNCHVVEGAQKVSVKQQDQTWVAALKYSDPKGDRCVIEVAQASWTPITGVRAYADLKVGEALYALGAPSGLDLTLTDGILSARREHEGVRYVQTTTPISPGSSGGGLFDARGNLVGITTLVFVGKEHLNQALNFAIAAEMYWNP